MQVPENSLLHMKICLIGLRKNSSNVFKNFVLGEPWKEILWTLDMFSAGLTTGAYYNLGVIQLCEFPN